MTEPSRTLSRPASGPSDPPAAGQDMEGLRTFLEALRDNNLIEGRLRGVLHVAIGRRITKADGTLVSAGATWRELAALLKTVRFDREWVREFAEDTESISPRDREKFWYSAIGLAHVESPEAVLQAEKLVVLAKPLGYTIGPSPVQAPAPKAAGKSPKHPPSKKKAN